MSTEIENKENSIQLPTYDLGNTELPNLDEALVLPLSLGGEYWTPQDKGESKRVFLQEIRDAKVQDFNSKQLIDLECVFFLEQYEGINTRTIYNGSKVLVGIIEANILSGIIKKGTPLEIKYLGKQKNKGNGNSSDRWDVKPLIMNI